LGPAFALALRRPGSALSRPEGELVAAVAGRGGWRGGCGAAAGRREGMRGGLADVDARGDHVQLRAMQQILQDREQVLVAHKGLRVAHVRRLAHGKLALQLALDLIVLHDLLYDAWQILEPEPLQVRLGDV
jgi:hypothetical protein